MYILIYFQHPYICIFMQFETHLIVSGDVRTWPTKTTKNVILNFFLSSMSVCVTKTKWFMYSSRRYFWWKYPEIWQAVSLLCYNSRTKISSDTKFEQETKVQAVFSY